MAAAALLTALITGQIGIHAGYNVGKFMATRNRAASAIITRSNAAIVKSVGKAKARPEQYRVRIQLMAQVVRYYADTQTASLTVGQLREYARRFPGSAEGKFADQVFKEYESSATRYQHVVPYYVQFLASNPAAEEEKAAISFLKHVEASTQAAPGKAAYLGSRRHMASKEQAPKETAGVLLEDARKLLSQGGKKNARKHPQGVEKIRLLFIHYPLAPEAMQGKEVLFDFQKKFKSKSAEPARRLLIEWPPRSYP